jgi:hypothetical protein
LEPVEAQQPQVVKRRRRKTRRWMRRISKVVDFRGRRVRAILMIVAPLLVFIIAGLVLVTDGMNRVSASLTNLNRVILSLSDKTSAELTLTDFDRLRSSVSEVLSSLEMARGQLIVLEPFRALNSDINATLLAFDAGRHLALSSNDMLDGLQPALFFLVAGDERESVAAQISSGERLIELLQIGRGRFERASESLETARTIIEGIPLSDVSSDTLVRIQNLRTYQGQLDNINNLLTEAPELLTLSLGLDSSRTYLILAQNSDELRPSGGYVSTWGWMTVRDAGVTDYGYSPTTTTSPTPPPASMSEEVQIPDWWIQYDQPIYAAFDGSWYADFPSTAEMALWYYNSGGNELAPVDGVIAIDLVGFEYVLQALGSVVVPEFDEVVTFDNFRQVVYGIRATGEGEVPHKRFLSALYGQIFAEWQSASGDSEQNARLLNACLRALQEKHIMLYFADPRLNSALNVLGWSGAQAEAVSHDYIMVADANLGNKSNRSIVRDFTYDVDIQADGALNSRLTVAYNYPASLAENDPAVDPAYHGPLNYGNLLQMFVPAGSQLAASDNFMPEPRTITAEAHTAFVAPTFVEYDMSARYQVSYTTPPLVETLGTYRRYRLLVQKQPGTIAERLTVQITLPASALPISVSPEPAADYDLDRPVLEFLLDLTTDQWIDVIFTG